MKVPFNSLKPQTEELQKELIEQFIEGIQKCDFIGGNSVTEFEHQFCEMFGLSNVSSCANGTDAIYLTLRAFDIGPGDHVLTPVHSWISSAEVISQCGADLEFVDSSSEGFCLDIEDTKKRINNRTKAIIAVHLYGEPADVESLRKICDEHGIFLIEDCSQAHGAEINGIKVGSVGDASTFSLFPSKNLGALGDAGIVAFKAKHRLEHFKLLANHGGKGEHLIEGVNSRLDALQARFLKVKLKYFNQFQQQRYLIANRYNESFQFLDNVQLPIPKNEGAIHGYHVYTIRLPLLKESRDEIIKDFKSKGIEVRLTYKKLLCDLPPYQEKFSHQEYPNARRNQDSMLSLPLYPGMTKDSSNLVIETFKEIIAKA